MISALPTPAPSPSAPAPAPSAPPVAPTPTCDADAFCTWMYQVTGSSWFAQSSFYLLVKPFRMLMIVVLAMVVRYLLHRAINRLVTGTSETAGPAILRPLRERVPTALRDATAVFPERRRQRAAAIGSVLRSSVTVAVFSVATLLVLGELGVNLAPLLASAGIAGVALGFGAQTLVKDLIAGLFMLLEDQYGVGDTVDLGEATGIVESVGLRITTVRDGRGVLWYIRNGEIVRVGNKSQGWAMVVVDIPIGFVSPERAMEVLRDAVLAVAQDSTLATDILDPPQVLGVEQVTVDGAVLRTTVKTTTDGQFPVGRELRRRITEALESSGLGTRIAASRMYSPPASTGPAGADQSPRVDSGPAGAT